MFEPDWLQAKTELTGGYEAVLAELAVLLCPSRMSQLASFSTALAVAKTMRCALPSSLFCFGIVL